MRITSTTNAERVQHDGTVYEADQDGVFEVPQHVGEELTSFPGWLPEHEAAAIAADEQAARDNDVVRLADRVAELESQLTAIEERLAALEPDEKPAKPPAKTTKTT